MGFPFLTIFLIFLIWLTIMIHRSNAKIDAQEEKFWENERIANSTPAKDISNLRYITIPIEKFPLNFSNDPDVLDTESKLKELSQKKLLNLTGKTNTELKMEYGVPNFEKLSQMGNDFDEATILLNHYGKALVEAERYEDAIAVLEFAVGVGTDISESYTLLSQCYKVQNNSTKLELLKNQVEQSNLILKDNILKKIN